jgi:long-chain acyl-CoA synthetase
MTENPRVAAALKGMTLAHNAGLAPDRPAVWTPTGERTFAELNGNANRLARALRARGCQAGDGLTILCGNRVEFVEALYAGLRTGMRVTPINWHLTGDEVGYIVDDCEATAFVADAAYADQATAAAKLTPRLAARLAVGGPTDGFDDYDDALGAEDPSDLDDPKLGSTMLYTSGTTGRPKGVHRADRQAAVVAPGSLAISVGGTARFDAEHDCVLCNGPLYHAAPLAFSLVGPMAAGVSVVVMEQFEPEDLLRMIERFRVTHTHVVPIMFHRLLALPDDVRGRYDISSLRYVIHGAAPCPVDVKRAAMEWLGPIIYEYYAATEGGGVYVTPQEWLERPGTVGKPPDASLVILDERGEPVPTGEVGTVYFRAPERGRFEYFKAPDKTAGAYRDDLFTLGDMGYLDDDGYLFLTGRSAELIISGGVNIYPAEIDAALVTHPAIADVATIGVPNAEWGEEVKAVVQLRDGIVPSDDLARELVEHCRSRLARFKCPRTVDFVDELPRHDTGKIYRRLVRDTYWTEPS